TTLDCVGPLARSVEDAALVLGIIDEHREKTSRRRQTFTIGIPKEFFFDFLSIEVQTEFESALRLLRKTGCKTKEISIPLLNNTEEAGKKISWAETTHYHQQKGWVPKHSTDYRGNSRARFENRTPGTATRYL